jgi:hypothetical protein
MNKPNERFNEEKDELNNEIIDEDENSSSLNFSMT